MVGMLASAVAALFATWNLNIGKQLKTLEKHADDWRGLYEKEVDKHDKTRAESAEDIRDLTGAVRDLTEVVKQVPRRREDWIPERAQRDQT